MTRNANGEITYPKDLPSKDCAHCSGPFVWRKKWAREWDSIKFCSGRCRRAAQEAALRVKRAAGPR